LRVKRDKQDVRDWREKRDGQSRLKTEVRISDLWPSAFSLYPFSLLIALVVHSPSMDWQQ
jgi:hypothetical protein